MKNLDNDILQAGKELKEMPYSVPDGYFDSVKKDIIRMTTQAPVQTGSIWMRMAPFAAMAAMFLFILTVGTLFIRGSVQDETISQEDYVVFSEGFTIEEYDIAEQYASAEDISREDIIEYLIYTGVSTETIELSNE